MSAIPNPVEQRLLHLCDLWSQFVADASKRLLIRQLQDNAFRIVHGFFEVQKHQTEYTTGDMFLIFDVPFESSLEYSDAFQRARELLGDGWPLDNPVALPPPSAKKDASA